MNDIRAAFAGTQLQLRLTVRTPDAYMLLITAPLTCATLLLLFSATDRADLAPLAVVAAGVMAAFQGSFFAAGELLTIDRRDGNLEMMLSTPSRFFSVLLGRTAAIVVVSMLAVVECWLVGAAWAHVSGAVSFVPVSPFHAVIAFVVSGVGLVGLTAPLAPLSLLTRAVRVYQNSIPWPLFLISGVLVPVAFLPFWIQPVAVLSPLYWMAALLRELLSGNVGREFAVAAAGVFMLGIIGVGIGALCMRSVLLRVQFTAELGLQ